MRALALARRRDRVRLRVWQTTCTAVRAGDEGFVIDSPVYPEELGRCPACSSRPASRSRGCSPPTATGTTCSGGSRSPARRSAARESTVARLAAELGAGPARAARVRRRALRRPAAAPLALGSLQSLPVPGRLRARSGPSARARAAPDRRPHRRRRRAFWLPWCDGAGVRRLPVAGRDPDDLAGRLGRAPTGDAGAPRGAGRAGRVGRPRARRADLAASAHAGGSLREDRAYLDGARRATGDGTPRCRDGAGRTGDAAHAATPRNVADEALTGGFPSTRATWPRQRSDSPSSRSRRGSDLTMLLGRVGAAADQAGSEGFAAARAALTGPSRPDPGGGPTRTRRR